MSARWRRPEAPERDPTAQKLLFQMVDLDHYVRPIKSRTANFPRKVAPLIRIFGSTKEGHSVLCHVNGFLPYFYVLPPPSFEEEDLEEFRESLNRAVLGEIDSNENVTEAVLKCELVTTQNTDTSTDKRSEPLVKITMTVPGLIAPSKKVLEGALVSTRAHPGFNYKLFEADIDFELRFMVDTHTVGCSWITLPPGKYTLRSARDKTALCQYEADIYWEDFVSHRAEGDYAGVAPFRVLSFDIECAGRSGIFPEPHKDKVIQIATMVMQLGQKEPFIRNIMTLDTCAPIDGVDVISFDTESKMLDEWAAFVRIVDPDIITGYNILHFDYWYLACRAKHVEVNSFPHLGRIKESDSVIKDRMIKPKWMRRRENLTIKIEGRISFDLLLVLLRDCKLKSYTLDAVSYKFLNDQKEDIQHGSITDLQLGDEQSRRRLALYCLKDALLPLRLLEKLGCIINYVELARITGVPFSRLLPQSQQIQIHSLLLRQARKQQFVLPGIVAHPYDNRLRTPGVSQTRCYSMPHPSDGMPSGYTFGNASCLRELSLQILEQLLSAHNEEKVDFESEEDQFRKKLLDGRQLAFERCAKSVYGFLGALQMSSVHAGTDRLKWRLKKARGQRRTEKADFEGERGEAADALEGGARVTKAKNLIYQLAFERALQQERRRVKTLKTTIAFLTSAWHRARTSAAQSRYRIRIRELRRVLQGVYQTCAEAARSELAEQPLIKMNESYSYLKHRANSALRSTNLPGRDREHSHRTPISMQDSLLLKNKSTMSIGKGF